MAFLKNCRDYDNNLFVNLRSSYCRRTSMMQNLPRTDLTAAMPRRSWSYNTWTSLPYPLIRDCRLFANFLRVYNVHAVAFRSNWISFPKTFRSLVVRFLRYLLPFFRRPKARTQHTVSCCLTHLPCLQKHLRTISASVSMVLQPARHLVSLRGRRGPYPMKFLPSKTV